MTGYSNVSCCSIHLLNHLIGIAIIYFQLTVNGGPGEHGTPALKDVMGACRPQPGLLLRKPRMEGVPVLGSSQGPNTAMNYPVLQKEVRVKFM